MSETHISPYLDTAEAAGYLRIKERKLYELAADGAVPCSKVTGKWLFPRVALDRWVESGLSHPAGLRLADPPPIIGGSHDPLLEWAVRHSGSGLALLSEGSSSGLEKLTRDAVMMAAIHLHAAGQADQNWQAVHQASALFDAVLIAIGRREQGLLLRPGMAMSIHSLSDALGANLRPGQRQAGAGAQLLFETWLETEALPPGTRETIAAAPVYATGSDLAFAIRAGSVDFGVATRAAAISSGLDFVPLIWERFDLVLRRRSYFSAPVQKLMACLRSADFGRHAEALGGYDISEAGMVRLNR